MGLWECILTENCILIEISIKFFYWFATHAVEMKVDKKKE